MITGTQSIGVYIDNSLSMQNSDGQKPQLELARKTASDLTRIFPPATQYFYLDNQFLSKDRKTLTSETFSDRLTETSLAATTRSLQNIYKKQLSILENTSSQAKKLFWLSDFQKSTVGNLAALKIDSAITLYIVPFQNESTSNVYIDSVWLENIFVKQNEKNTLKVKLKNNGNRTINNLHLKLTIDGVQSGMSSVELNANSEVLSNFDFTVKDKSLKKCIISFDDNPVTFDNAYYFCINVAPVINILSIANDRNSFVRKVYSNEDIFLLQSNSIVNVIPNEVEKAQLIVIEEFDKLSLNALGLIKSQIEKGKNVLLFPSDNPGAENLSTAALALQLPALIPVASQTAAVSLIDNLESPNLKNPFFNNIFEQNEKNIDVPFAKPVISWGKKGQMLLQTKQDLPFLSIFSKGLGHVYICSTPLLEPFTGFQKHSFFVPVMYKIAMNSAETNKKLGYSFDDRSIAVYVANTSPQLKYAIKKEKFEYIPEQTLRGNTLVFGIPNENPEAGFYNLELGDSVITSLALNISKAESKLDVYKPEELKTIFDGRKNIVLYENASNSSFINDFEAAYIGIALWKYCLIAVLFFLMMETLIIRFFKS